MCVVCVCARRMCILGATWILGLVIIAERECVLSVLALLLRRRLLEW